MSCLKILAVADPALAAYTDKNLNIFQGFDGIVSFEQYQWADYIQKLNQSLYEDLDFDIVMIPGHLFLKDLVTKNLLYKTLKLKAPYFKSLYYDLELNNQNYALPSFYDGHIIVYRKGFDKRLDNDDSLYLSTDNFCDIAKNSFKGKFSLKAHKSEIFTDALPFLRFFDAKNRLVDVFYDDGSVRDLMSFEKRLDTYCKLKDYAIYNTHLFGNDEVANAFIEGKTNLMVTWSGQLSLINNKMPLNNKDFGFKTFDSAWSVTWEFVILEKSKQKDKAQELFSYLQSLDIDTKCFTYSGTTLRQDNEISYPWKDANIALLNSYTPLPYPKKSNVNGILYEYIYKAFTKELSAHDALFDANLKIKQLMESQK